MTDAPVPRLPKLQRELVAALSEGRPPDFSAAPADRWVNALDRLLMAGHIEAAAHGLGHFEQVAPHIAWAPNMRRIIALTPSADPAADDWDDDKSLDLQVVAVEGAHTVVLAFCGQKHRIGFHTPLFHRFIQQQGWSMVFLRDFQGVHFLNGVAGIGPDRPSTIEALGELISRLGARRTLCLGNSSGGYAALLYALELGADAALSFSGGTNLDPDFNVHLNRAQGALELREAFPDEELDLRARYLAAAQRPRAMLVYGEYAWDDRIHAEHMSDVPGAELIPILDFEGHGSIAEAVMREEFEDLLGALAA
jgi:hypothetical protein